MMPFAFVAQSRWDADALAHIAQVEAADGQPLEPRVKRARNRFIRQCKRDASPVAGVSNWDAIKACCLLAGAKTLAGALVPLRGPAPTNFNFVSGDYSATAGLKGNGTNKVLGTNYTNVGTSIDIHVSVFSTTDFTVPGVAANYIANEPSGSNPGLTRIIKVDDSTTSFRVAACTGFAQRSYEIEEGVDGFLDEVESGIFAISETRLGERTFRIKDSVMDALDSIEKLYERKGAITGLSTGFADFDQMTDGLHPGEMIVIAARPSMGKTALAMNIAEHVALNDRHAVAVFSLEMSSQQLVQRLLCSRAKVNLQKVRDGFLTDRNFHDLTTAAQALAESKVFIDDTAGLSILELRAKSRRLKAQHNIGLIVIDYLQLLKSPSKRGQDNRQLEISEISSGIKALAKELEVPIIVLAQLNRNPEARAGGKPRLSDLRESGSIEQDADLVGLLVRSEYYAADEEERESTAGEAELIIAKQRNGPVGEVPLTFLKEFARFETRARETSAKVPQAARETPAKAR